MPGRVEMRVEAGAITLEFRDGARERTLARDIGSGSNDAGIKGRRDECVFGSDAGRRRHDGGIQSDGERSDAASRAGRSYGSRGNHVSGKIASDFGWRECTPSIGSGPGFDFSASKLATEPVEAGSLRLGASTTLAASELPRAT